MKLLERLRWLPTDRPPPGTAEVSAKSCVLATLVGDTPGTSSARSRKLRPFIGRFRTSACDTVPAIWLRAASSTVASALTVTLASSVPTRQRHRQLERRADGERQRARRVGESLQPDGDLVAADFQIREAEPSVLIGDRFARHVGLGLARADLRAGHDRALRIRRRVH